MRTLFRSLASPMLMAIFLIVLGVSSAIATFIENDFGSNAARALVYNTWWFEAIFALLSVNLVAAIFVRKLFCKQKLPIFLFHIAFVIIVVGAAITRYTGQEGTLHIREGETVSAFTSNSSWLNVFANNVLVHSKAANFSAVTRNSLQASVSISSNQVDYKLLNFIPKNVLKASSNLNFGSDVLQIQVTVNGTSKEVFVPKTDAGQNPKYVEINGLKIGFKYGPRIVPLPFQIELNDFILERYPGSSSPSSFISKVTVVDKSRSVRKPFNIFMNNVLNYRGYRFYQSSYDEDEQGTYLSVNKDFAGTAVTYFGYFLMIVGMIWTLVSPHSRFRKLLNRKKQVATVLILLLFSSGSWAQNSSLAEIVPSSEHAKKFGSLLVQDKGGRVKPVSTLAGETLRKLNRSNGLNGYNAEQVFLGMISFPEQWQHIPVVKVSNAELKEIAGIESNHASFVNFFDFDSNGSYKLAALIQHAFLVKPAQRTPFQKDIVKVDERVNVLYMVFSGQLAQLFPQPGSVNERWQTMAEIADTQDSSIVDSRAQLFTSYIAEVRSACRSGNWANADLLLSKLATNQKEAAGVNAPSELKVKSEVLVNRLLPFERLIPVYGITGAFLLMFSFIILFSKKRWIKLPATFFGVILFLGFIFHSFAIALRWYIAGRVPLSNGYESMVYVAWATMLAGYIFAKRSRVVVPATALLSTLTLFVAHLSWMDPEITNLVPVLKSYWLTIHVAVITASYGFLGLGAFLGVINLVLIALKPVSRISVIKQQVEEITVINELTLTIGLYLLTIGSFLGAVWANESWGRYWGWDPKETWAFITILVYTFIVHMRLIPNFRNVFTFNFASILGIASVLMTYFGVNYYLSGLHSYAGGETIPFPKWIYLSVALFFAFSIYAWRNSRLIYKDITGK